MTVKTLLKAKKGYEANIAAGKDKKGFDAMSLAKVNRNLATYSSEAIAEAQAELDAEFVQAQ